MTKNTREKLVQTAQDLIGASSYASVGVAEMCKRAGVNKGSFYHFFESKEEIALEALNECSKEHEGILDDIFSADKSANEQLDAFIDCFYSHQLEDYEKNGKVLGCPAVNLGSEMATQNQHFCDSVHDIFKRYDKYFTILTQSFIDEGVIDKSANAEVLGKIIHTYILGLKITSKIENSPLVLKEDLKPTILSILGVK